MCPSSKDKRETWPIPITGRPVATIGEELPRDDVLVPRVVSHGRKSDEKSRGAADMSVRATSGQVDFGTLAVVALLAFHPAAHSQTPAFEVASLKLSETAGRASKTVSNGRLTMRNQRLISLLEWAYDVSASQVTIPDSMSAIQYDIVAKADSALPETELKLMLQNLLAERIHLALHRETRPVQVLVMTAGKDKPRLEPAPDNGPQTMRVDNGIGVLKGITMAGLGAILNGAGPPLTVDRTGITGRFDITLDSRPYIEAGSVPSPQAMIEAIRESIEKQIGLRFSRAKVPLDFLIVDRADKVPVEN